MSSPEHLREAARAVHAALDAKNIPYALVGGSACVMLGSRRQTRDIDLVVPRGGTPAARRALRDNPDMFRVEPRTNHTYYNKYDIPIEILAPPGLFRSHYDDKTPIYEEEGVRILKPTLLLEAKCGSFFNRASEAKTSTDALDIKFLLVWLARKHQPSSMQPGAMAEIPDASTGKQGFCQLFIQQYGGEQLWEAAGYDTENGCWRA